MRATHQSWFTLMLGVSLVFAAHGNTFSGDLSDAPIDALRRIYLVCERASRNATLNADGFAYCSTVYEQLERRKCEAGNSPSNVSSDGHSSKDCERLKVLLPRTMAQ